MKKKISKELSMYFDRVKVETIYLSTDYEPTEINMVTSEHVEGIMIYCPNHSPIHLIDETEGFYLSYFIAIEELRPTNPFSNVIYYKEMDTGKIVAKNVYTSESHYV